jgi:branched-chain amino acid transport system substrate-binding protein
MQVQTLVSFISDVLAMGSNAAGLRLSQPFYWNLNDRTRAFANRYAARIKDAPANTLNAGAYSATVHYLRAALDLGLSGAKQSGRDVVERMKKMPTNDDCFGVGALRVDGRKIHPCYLFEVKKPEQRATPFDCLSLVRTVPEAEAFRPLGEGECALVQK